MKSPIPGKNSIKYTTRVVTMSYNATNKVYKLVRIDVEESEKVLTERMI